MIVGVDARHIVGKKRGIGYYIENIIKEMVKIYNDIEFILFIHKDLNMYFLNKRIKIKKIYFPLYSRLSSPFWLNFLLLSNLKREKVDLLFCPNFFSPYFYNGKIVITIHDLAPYHFPEFFQKFYPFYFKFFLPLSIEKAHAIITPTKFIKDEVEKFFPKAKGKTFYVYHGVDDFFKPANNKNLFDFSYILYVGAITKRKNVIGILEVFNILKRKYKLKHYLLLVGKKEEGFKEIERKIDEHLYKDFIIFKDYVEKEELLKIYQNADIFLFISFYEGFGFPVIEAMKCGVPCVISNIDSLIEITEGKIPSFYPLDYEGIAEKIYEILNNEELKKELVKKGFEISSKYKWEESAKSMYEIFKNVIY